MGAVPAQTMYDAIKADRLDPEKAQVTRVVGGGGGATASQLPATLGVKTQALSLSTGLAQDENTWAQLTAPGVTAAFSTVGYKRITAAYTVAAINTNVVLRLEGSMDGTNWFNLSSTNADTTVTTNGTNAFNVEAAVDQVRLNFVSESGGTAATVDATVRVSS
jgi:hypothetical protein